jgi:hypothetical protein
MSVTLTPHCENDTAMASHSEQRETNLHRASIRHSQVQRGMHIPAMTVARVRVRLRSRGAAMVRGVRMQEHGGHA